MTHTTAAAARAHTIDSDDDADDRARLARAWLDAHALPAATTTPRRLGQITLLPHQESAIAPLIARLARYRGALLADAPGLGKTYVALAVAHQLGCARPLVIAPATLVTRWRDASRETGVELRTRSVESFGQRTRGGERREARDALVIIDEAHHLRTITTRRWHAVSELCRRARLLLLSATPFHNGDEDVATIAALFRVAPGSRDLARTLRRITVARPLAAIRAAAPDEAEPLRIPHVDPVRTIALPPRDDATLDAILRLPPAPDDDGPTGHAAARLALVHAWCSSTAALAAMLRRRIARALAIEAACEAGVAPTRDVTRAWHATHDGAAVQLALAPLLVSTEPPAHAASAAARARQHAEPHGDARDLGRRRRETARHRLAVEQLLASLDATGDDARARTLLRLARWGAPPVVAFTRSRITARALWQRLRDVAGVALVTGSEAEIASGAVSRDELLAMLRAGAVAPARTPHDGADAQLRRTRVRLLVATDVASEGLSLAGARTVVHLDEPWTPARLLQRTGRAARIGAPVERVRVVRLAPPATRDEYARVERVLARKAGRLVHVDALMRRTRSDDTLAAITRIARRWSTPAIARRPQAACGVAVRADARRDAGPRDADEWLVALQVGRGTHVRTVVRLVARTGEVRRAGLRAWRRADLAPRPPDATYAAAAPAWLGHVIAGWWALRDDPLDRRASVTAERPHPPLRDAPALARIRGALDAAIDGAAPLERHACARGAERVRQRLRGGVPAALLARWAARAGDEARCRRWLVARGRHVASGARDRRVHAAPVIVAAIPLDARRGPTGTA